MVSGPEAATLPRLLSMESSLNWTASPFSVEKPSSSKSMPSSVVTTGRATLRSSRRTEAPRSASLSTATTQSGSAFAFAAGAAGLSALPGGGTSAFTRSNSPSLARTADTAAPLSSTPPMRTLRPARLTVALRTSSAGRLSAGVFAPLSSSAKSRSASASELTSTAGAPSLPRVTRYCAPPLRLPSPIEAPGIAAAR